MRKKRNIVIGQRVDLDKVKRARMLRGQMTEEEGILWERLRANRCPGGVSLSPRQQVH